MVEVGEALGNLVDPRDETRKKAEAFLLEAQRKDGYATALLQISRDQSANQAQVKFAIDINLAAAIQFGKFVESHWKFKNEAQAKKQVQMRQKIEGTTVDWIVMKEADKKFVRENIMEAIREWIENKKVLEQYVRALKEICVHDYPSKLPGLFKRIMYYLN